MYPYFNIFYFVILFSPVCAMLDLNMFQKIEREKSSTKALEAINDQLEELDRITLTINGQNFDFNSNDYVGSGGSKVIYKLNDGRVIALPCIKELSTWDRMVKEEAKAAESVRNIGLYAQNYEMVTAFCSEHPINILLMPHFTSLLAEGIQVREHQHYYGSTQLFGQFEKLQNQEHWDALLKTMIDDVVRLMSHGYFFSLDAYHFAIVNKNSADSAKEDLVFSSSCYEAHFFLFDFTSKIETIPFEKSYYFVDKEGEILEDEIEKVAKKFVTKIMSQIVNGISDNEYFNLFGCTKLSQFFPDSPIRSATNGVYNEDEIKQTIVARVKAELSTLSQEEIQKRFSDAPLETSISCILC